MYETTLNWKAACIKHTINFYDYNGFDIYNGFEIKIMHCFYFNYTTWKLDIKLCIFLMFCAYR